jgi:hypothetical protein
MRARVDDQDAVGTHAVTGQPFQPRANLSWQSRDIQVDPQFHGGLNFVDVLTSRTGGAQETFVESVGRKGNG